MTGRIAGRLKELGIELADGPAPMANYVPFVQTGSNVFISGQVPLGPEGLRFKGKVGTDYTVEEGQQAARLCAVNLIAQLSKACGGDLDKVVRCVKLGGFVNCTPEFDQHPAVINGASDLMVEVFGDAGRHARFAVGAAGLPFGVAVEVDAVFEVR